MCNFMDNHYLIFQIILYTGLPELEKVVVLPFVGKPDEIDLSNIPNRYLWDYFMV